ncbi:hypothetical protein EV361DRAFT_941316 [Lentinula raphanica]|nr:hypothetical protein EV361DRAFT_941316 [Lentinula raphanica]
MHAFPLSISTFRGWHHLSAQSVHRLRPSHAFSSIRLLLCLYVSGTFARILGVICQMFLYSFSSIQLPLRSCLCFSLDFSLR